MQANENLYGLMETVSNNLEEFVCSLAVHIENAGIELEEFKYKVFNDFYNEVINLEKESVSQIKVLFQDSKDEMIRILDRVKADEFSKNQMTTNLMEMETRLVALSIHMENLREINSVADSVIIPEPKNKLYEAFSGFGKILDKCPDLRWDSQNAFESIIVSFYNNSVGVFEQLCIEYDKKLRQISLELDDRQKKLKQMALDDYVEKYDMPVEVPNKSLGEFAKDMALAGAKVAIAGAGLYAAVQAGSVAGILLAAADVAVPTVGLLAKVGEQIGEPPPGNKSKARNILNKAQAYNAAIELADELVEGKVSNNVSSVAKLMIGAMLIKNNGTFKEGQLERITNVAGFVNGITNIVTIVKKPEKIPKDVLKLLKNGLDSMNCGVNIIKDMAEKSSENPKAWSYVPLQKVNTYFKEYENKIKIAQIQRKKYGFSKKVKPPPGIKNVNCLGLMCDIMDVFEDIFQ